MWKQITDRIRSSYTDEERRKRILFTLLNLLLAMVSGVMTAVNLFSAEYELMAVTGAFSLLCLLNCLAIRCQWMKESIVVGVFTVEAMFLLVYFVLGGVPEGFSVLWTLLVPAISLPVFGKKIGVRFNALTFLMVVFFFWIPLGRSLLYYNYNEVFMLRFPFVYICLFAASAYIDTIRIGVYNKLKETEEKARHLYRHDALTGIYSRHAFYEALEQLFATSSKDSVSALMLDIDDFKLFNDLHGHNAGDAILKSVAHTILDNICEHCIACRWGGEEFLVLMQCGHDPYELAEKIRTLVQNTLLTYDGKELRVTVSVGIAVADSPDKTRLSGFINCADRAMYASKAAGKNKTTLVYYHP